MQTTLAEFLRGTVEGEEAEQVLRKCVHCGFCNATCPTYQILGDELDGPRGRISLIKEMVEGQPVSAETRLHLDRCLTCRACETTCPSGVEYGRLAEVGRKMIEQRVPRPRRQRLTRWLLIRFLLSGPLFRLGVGIGRGLRPLLTHRLRQKIPPAAAIGDWPAVRHPRKMILLAGCVQPAMLPHLNRATARVLDHLGISTLVAPAARCCGALRLHLGENDAALDDIRRSIDAWWPLVEGGAEGFLMNASGCGVTVREWGRLLRSDSRYADKARRISEMTRDVSEVVAETLPSIDLAGLNLVFQAPCTLQHGQRLGALPLQILSELGATVRTPVDAHLCCGSAGTYSLLQPALSAQLRRRKLAALDASGTRQIVSANVGCIAHLQREDAPRVRHWIEVIDEALSSQCA